MEPLEPIRQEESLESEIKYLYKVCHHHTIVEPVEPLEPIRPEEPLESEEGGHTLTAAKNVTGFEKIRRLPRTIINV